MNKAISIGISLLLWMLVAVVVGFGLTLGVKLAGGLQPRGLDDDVAYLSQTEGDKPPSFLQRVVDTAKDAMHRKDNVPTDGNTPATTATAPVAAAG